MNWYVFVTLLIIIALLLRHCKEIYDSWYKKYRFTTKTSGTRHKKFVWWIFMLIIKLLSYTKTNATCARWYCVFMYVENNDNNDGLLRWPPPMYDWDLKTTFIVRRPTTNYQQHKMYTFTYLLLMHVWCSMHTCVCSIHRCTIYR